MYPNYFLCTPQPSNPFLPTTLLGHQSMYHHPAVYPGTHPNFVEYNPLWGPEEQQAFVHNINQLGGEGPPTAGVAATINNDAHQCRWCTGSGPCRQVCANFDELMDHLRDAHDVRGSAARKLVCRWFTDTGYCNKKYRRDGYRRHIRTHVPCPVPCTECGKLYSRKDSMHDHRKKEHAKQ